MSALDSELAALPTLSAHQLRLKWQDLRCGEPTAAASRDLMIREIAYKMQERAHGGAGSRDQTAAASACR